MVNDWESTLGKDHFPVLTLMDSILECITVYCMYDLIICSLAHNQHFLKISLKATHNFSGYFVHK